MKFKLMLNLYNTNLYLLAEKIFRFYLHTENISLNYQNEFNCNQYFNLNGCFIQVVHRESHIHIIQQCYSLSLRTLFYETWSLLFISL